MQIQAQLKKCAEIFLENMNVDSKAIEVQTSCLLLGR